MIKYKIRKFVFTYDERREEETNGLKRYVGFFDAKLNIVKDEKDAMLFTKEEIISNFGENIFNEIHNWKSNEYEFVWVSNELDEFINKIKLITKKQFVNEEIIDFGKFGKIVALIGDVRKPKVAQEFFKNGEWYKNQFYLAWYGNDNHKIADAYCGGVKPDMAKAMLEEKVRRHFNYDNPYNHPVEDKTVLDDYWKANMEPKLEENKED